MELDEFEEMYHSVLTERTPKEYEQSLNFITSHYSKTAKRILDHFLPFIEKQVSFSNWYALLSKEKVRREKPRDIKRRRILVRRVFLLAKEYRPLHRILDLVVEKVSNEMI
jgi:hypothetical protein